MINLSIVICFYNDTSPNKLGEEISKFSKDQQEFIRNTVVNDYKKQGWQATWDKWIIDIHAYVLVKVGRKPPDFNPGI